MLDSFRSTDFEQLSKFVPLPMWLISDIPVWCFVPDEKNLGRKLRSILLGAGKGLIPSAPEWRRQNGRKPRISKEWRDEIIDGDVGRPCQCHFSRVGNDWGFPVFQSNKPDFDELAWIGVPIEEQHHLLSTWIQTLEFPRFTSSKSRGTFGCQGAL